jgi:parallel beta-helix repeat protein
MKTHNTKRRIGMGNSFALFFGLTIFITSCKKDENVRPANATTKETRNGSTNANSLFFSGTMSKTRATYTASAPINLNGSHDLFIRGKSINGGSVPAITLRNCYNIHITGNMLGNSTDAGIYLYNCYNITIDSNDISNVSTGVSVVNTIKGNILIIWNEFKNMQGPMPRGQFVQFNTVSGPNNLIDNNRCENIFGSSYPEDAINLYKSSGTASSPIKVTNNWIRGGGPSASGGGIMLGDNGGSYQVASGNILVDPGQYGMAIAGGDHISMINNSIYGRAQSFTNIGLYIWGQSGSVCTNNTISWNKICFKNAANMENDAWIGTGESTPSGWSTNVWGAKIDASILPSKVVSF